MNEKISVIIPAAGMGRRMKSYGPKPLIKIGNSTIINNQILSIRSFIPDAEIILVCGFKADRLMNETPRNIIKIENELYETTNVVRSIGMGLRAAKDTDTILIVYGDLVFNRAAIERLNLESSCVVLDGGGMSEEEVGCIVNKDGYLESIMYDLPDKWAQIGVFKSKELKLLQKLCWDKKNYKKFGFEIINSIVERGGAFKCVQGDDIRVVDIDSSKDIKRAVEILK